jgi:Fe-S oxidoreductase
MGITGRRLGHNKKKIMKNKPGIEDISNKNMQLVEITEKDLLKLPFPFNESGDLPAIKGLSDEQKKKYECSLDGVVGIGLTKPNTKEEEDKLVQSFLTGLRKLMNASDNWTFLQPLVLSLEYCAKCQNCSDSCPIYIGSGKKEVYRPTYRAEVLRRIIKKYLKTGGRLLSKLSGEDIALNREVVSRLAESVYRCTLCRKCAQACPIGVDNGLITHEVRKLFSQEMGISPKEIHEHGTIQQLKVGSTTGITPKALVNLVNFMEGEIEDKTGKKIKIPIDKEGADILFLHNAGEFISWPENMEAYAIIFDTAGINWTISSELYGYDGVNYGVWYDDIQLARIVTRHAQVARDLKVKRISVGECGHAHKVLLVIADRILTGDLNIPRESAIPLLADLVCKKKVNLNPELNNFPVTLHDPCNLVRMTGIIEPQRRILRAICPQFLEMQPNGVENNCCGGGSGFAIMAQANFPEWRSLVAGRVKFKQILETFQDVIKPEIKKYVCAPCSNCKGQFRDMFSYYGVWDKCSILYGGLAELIVNAMTDIKQPFINWEWR